MPPSIVLPSTLVLTLLLTTGLAFFLRASSKDRTMAMVISSYRPSLTLLRTLDTWLAERGWQVVRTHPEQRRLVYEGHVAASIPLAILLAFLGCCGGVALGLVISQMLPKNHPWPLALGLVGLAAAPIYLRRAQRREQLDLQLLTPDQVVPSRLVMRVHRDELLAVEAELGKTLQLQLTPCTAGTSFE
ncbi:MAG: hypothetical protein TH68_04990 [Candidatus Synechococcus spongiarum 142]|uniref:Cofactor assembly of complex C subunit B n=1 Tax=Candidatus Synechococcus spongiarum 142 TaxID=1608213 RepID=A0A6N3X0J6_9SYNE|nr:MAG: hypothetical protein TH68_04990 [Candidatus Synechococcus spongiarum 142]